MNNVYRMFTIFLFATALVACAGKPATKPEKAGAQIEGAAEEGAVTGERLGGPAGDVRPTVSRVLFAFDSAAIDTQNRETLEAHAAYLAANPDIQVRLEGHGDERGTREYNLALGERRAQAVARMLAVLGVNRNRLETASYGEEKPLDPGHDEAAWQRNRRVEIIY